MEETRLGRSGLAVSKIAFGTWQLGGDWGPTDEAEAVTAIRQAADQGVTFFDTAQAYGFGQSEVLLSKALDGRRDGLVVATKGGLRPTENGGVSRDASPAWVRQGVEESLQALHTDAIDLYQVHWPDPATPFEETAGALAALAAEGKIRHVGVSNFSAEDMTAFSATLPIETLQPPYHLFHRAVEVSVLPYAHANDIGVLAYGPLAHGLLSGGLHQNTRFADGDWRASSVDFRGDVYRRNLAAVAGLERLARDDLGISVSQLAVAWTLANPAVDVAIVGTRNPAHVHDAVAAADVKLEPDILRRIDEVMLDTQPIAGPSPEAMPES
jgi:aryl-alcohol dehydrogenase-like predicted oxidoreductase